MITSTTNRRVKLVRALQEKPRARQEAGAFVVEGLRLAREAVAAQLPAQLVLHTDHLRPAERAVVNGLARLGAEVEVVSERVMAACSSTESPPGLLAVVSMPQLTPPQPITLAVLADRLGDPGNLGTLMRTALAAGAEVLFLTHGSVDPFNPKVVRAAMGAHFHLPIEKVGAKALGSRLAGLNLWLAEAGAGPAYHQVDWRPPSALILGSEAHGAGRALRALAARSVHVPMLGPVESINVATAAAVILFEIARQRGAS